MYIYIYKFCESAWAVKSHHSGSGRYVWRYSLASSEKVSKKKSGKHHAHDRLQLVGGFNHLEQKWDRQWEGWHPIWKKNMFETTSKSLTLRKNHENSHLLLEFQVVCWWFPSLWWSNPIFSNKTTPFARAKPRSIGRWSDVGDVQPVPESSMAEKHEKTHPKT